jgi:LmbE family N-acetylglucosaminyl deacetylase
MNMKKVLVICAHPDDDILGCGGIMSKYVSTGTLFRVIFIAEGSSCRFNADELNSEAVLETIKERNNFGICALKKLGVNDFKFYNLPCGRLDIISIIEINKIIENEIKIFEPDTVFTHAEYDANNDHGLVFKATIMATRPCSSHKVKNLFSFEILSSTEWKYTNSFEPNYFEELNQNDVIKKWEALAEYETEIKEFPFPRSLEGISTLAKYRGLQAGVSYAEAFRIIRKIS